MAHGTKIGGTNYGISGGKCRVNGTNYSIKKGRTLVGGTGFDISFGVPIGELAVGTSVYMIVNGKLTEFIVVNQGNPSSLYDSSCDGTWILMKDAYVAKYWHSSNVNDYANSDIHAYLNGDFFNLVDTTAKTGIKQVKIPYRPGSGKDTTVNSGANGLSTKIFLLSALEVGGRGLSWKPTDGTLLSYFTNTASASSVRVCYYNGSAKTWWLRTPPAGSGSAGGTYNVYRVKSDGSLSGFNLCKTNNYVRPACIMNSETLVSTSDYSIIGL